MSAIFLLPVCLTYWPRKYATRVDPHVDNSHQVWSWYVHTLPRYSVFGCRHVTWPCDLDLWPFDLEQLQCMAGHVSKLATKLKDPMPIRSWFMRYNVSHWLPLKMCTRPLLMRRITWSVSRGSKTITFLESPTLICLFTYSRVKISNTSKWLQQKSCMLFQYAYDESCSQEKSLGKSLHGKCPFSKTNLLQDRPDGLESYQRPWD